MIKPLALFLCVIFSIPAWSQSNPSLVLNKKLSGEIEPGQSHRYSIPLKANQFAVVVVQQDGVDLLITSFDGAGKKLEDFDSPNGKQGPEMVTINSSLAGTYVLEVRPLNADEPRGKYSIELIRAEPKGATPEKQVDQILSSLVVPGSPGATIAVAKGDKIVLSKGYGSANPEYDIPNTPKTIFHIASISKQFTAFAIAMLADQGKLSLDDDIRKHLPELHDFGHKITIRHLAHHTSGLRDQWNLLAMAGWRLDDVITRDQVIRLMSHQTELNFKPGDEFNYCNTGYTFMGEIVARVSGKSFAEWCTENIFKPLGMNSTIFYDDHEKIVKGRAYSFYNSSDGLKKSVLSYANAGATSLFTTTEDLIKWSDNFQRMKVGNANVMKQMEERAILNKGDTLNYALGQDLSKYKGLKSASHGGADAGYRSFLVRFPEQKTTIVVLSNLASFNTGKLAYQIADIYLKDQLIEEVKPAPEKKDDTETVTVSEDLLKMYAGQYELGPGFIVGIKAEDGILVAQATGQPSFKMLARSEKEFYNATIDASITFEKDDTDKVNKFILKQGGQTVTAPRLKEFEPEKVDLSPYTGVYYSQELETRYTLEVKDNKLMAKHIRHNPMTLKPVKENTFAGDTWFMGSLEFIKDEKGAITGFKASSGRVKNVLFERIK